ncbi:dephospho-CoA kinase [Albibacterium profundi]|uniref:Dephospho-CoA kinase n=1 Tax=Albibacterium profundi TaxID=3134906 RepID=A0ABV5CF12_9SPHI
MLKIGITGGIGSGKTTVCKVFEILKIPVFYADDAAKSVMNKDPHLIDAIKREFGSELYSEEEILDRKALAKLVFNNSQALEKLNSLVHPAAIQAFEDWSKEQDSPYIIKEAAILFESGSYKDCDFTILVYTPENLRIKRVMKRDNTTEAEVRARIDKQMPEDKKRELSDFVIENDGSTALLPQVLSLHGYFLSRSKLNKS